jgi:hypothetical protein
MEMPAGGDIAGVSLYDDRGIGRLCRLVIIC